MLESQEFGGNQQDTQETAAHTLGGARRSVGQDWRTARRIWSAGTHGAQTWRRAPDARRADLPLPHWLPVESPPEGLWRRLDHSSHVPFAEGAAFSKFWRRIIISSRMGSQFCF